MLDGGTYGLSKIQKWIFDCWLDFSKRIPSGSVLLVNGDLVQGGIGRDVQLVSSKWSDQIAGAVDLLEIPGRRCSEIYLTYGTEYHDQPSGQALIGICDQLKARLPKVKIHEPEYEVWIQWGSKLVHATHHRSTSSSPTSKGTPLAGALTKMIVSAPMRNGMYPDIEIRSHAHDPGYLVSTLGVSIGLPAWQIKTGYAWHRQPEAPIVIGGTILKLEENEVCVNQILYKPSKTRPHQLSKK